MEAPKTSLIQLASDVEVMLQNSFGEITPEIEQKLMALATKADGAAYVLDRFEKAIEFWEQRKDLCAKMACSVGHAQDRLQAYISAAMKIGQMNELKGEEFRFQLQRGQGAVVVDHQNSIPEEFMVTTIDKKPDKKKIKDAIKAGKTVTGAHVEETEILRRYPVRP